MIWKKIWSADVLKAWKNSMKSHSKTEQVLSNNPNAPKSILSNKLKKLAEVKLDEINMKVDVGVLDFPALELARQITLIDQEIFRKISLFELTNKNFEKDDLAPTIKKANETFVEITLWVATEIVTTTVLKQRAKVVSLFINTCEKLLVLQNYNGLMTIFAGLSQVSISRLRSTWEILPPAIINKWREIEEIINPAGHYQTLRILQQNSEPPLVPCLSLLLQDLVIIEDQHADYVDEENKFLNFEKALLLGQLFMRIKNAQKKHYDLSQVDVIQKYFRELQYLKEEDLIKQSRVIEPSNLV